MRTFLYPNEYKPLIKKWEKGLKSFNPKKRKKAKEMIKVLKDELNSRYPVLAGMHEQTQDIFLEDETEKIKDKLFSKRKLASEC